MKPVRALRFIVICTSILATQLLTQPATGAYQQWQYWASWDPHAKFLTEKEAEEHMRAGPSWRDLYLTIRGPIVSMSRDQYRRVWTVAPRDPVETAPWRYYTPGCSSTNSSVYYGSYEEARDACFSHIKEGHICGGMNTLVGESDWVTTGDFLGWPRDKQKKIFYDSYLFARYPTPRCFYAPTNPASFTVVGTRSVGCPPGFKANIGSGKCVMAHTRWTYGKPVTTCGEEVGNPCDVANGSKLLREVDYAGPGIELTRTFNSQSEWHWLHSFSGYLLVSGTSALGFVTHSGHHEPFRNYGGGAFVAFTGSGLEARFEDNEWILYYPSGARDRFDSGGTLLARENAAGQATRVVRDAAGLIEALVGPFGHMLTFIRNEYGGVERIVDPAGQSIHYDLDALGRIHSVTYPDGTSRDYHYENADFPMLVTGITDEHGNRYSTYGYDENARVVSSEHAGGDRAVHLSYSADTTSVTDAQGSTTAYHFTDNAYRIRKIIRKSVGGSSKEYVYPSWRADNQQRPSEIIDERGIVTQYSYDEHHKTREIRAAGTGFARTVAFAYLDTATDRLTRVTSPSVYGSRRREIGTQYNDAGLPRLIEVTGYTPTGAPVSRIVSIEYNGDGQVTSIDGPRNDVPDITAFEYYACHEGSHCGQLAAVVNALGHRTSYEAYDAHGRLTRMTRPNGLVVSYRYDARGRVVTVEQTAPDGLTRRTMYAYDIAGLLESVQAPDGSRLSYRYDAAHNLISVHDALGHAIEYSYDLNGNRTSERVLDPAGGLAAIVEYAYDQRNRIETVNAAGSTTRLLTDALGNVTEISDPNGNRTVHDHDPFSRLTEVVDALNGSTTYGYDPNDALAAIRAPNGALTSYLYDDLGNLLAVESPDTGTTTLTHDEAGNVLSRTDANGILVHYRYDALNRLTAVSYPDTRLDVDFSYDAESSQIGRLTAMRDGAGTTVYEYDAFGNLMQQRRVIDGTTHVTEYGYDPMHRLRHVVYPSGRRVDYHRDAAGRIRGVATAYDGAVSTIASDITHEPFGPLSGLVFGNGLSMRLSFDLQYRPVGKVTGSIQDMRLTFDAAGNVDAKADSAMPGMQRTFTQDALHRIDSEHGPEGVTRYAYDDAGNRLTRFDGRGLETQTLAYSPGSNRMTSRDGAAVLLDAAGNTLLDTAVGASYAYGAHNRPVSVSIDGEPRATYAFDGQGQRIVKSETFGERRTFLFHFGLNGELLGESIYDSSGALLVERDYIWLDEMPLAQAEVRYSSLSVTDQSLVYIHTDHLDTPRLASDDTRTVVWRWRSDAFGVGEADVDPDGDGQLVDVRLRFPGQYADDESGLRYNYFRDYAPALGRFIQSDPVGLLGGLNTYNYADQNPTTVIDPTGEFGVIGGVYGAVSGGVGGYISSAGSWRGATYGALAGATVGFVNPLTSSMAGLAAGSALASAAGQATGLTADPCKNPLELQNYSAGAVIGAGLGGPVGKGIGRLAGSLIDPIRRNVLSRAVTSSGISRVNQNMTASVIEGTTVGTLEYIGSAILPASASDSGLCGCR